MLLSEGLRPGVEKAKHRPWAVIAISDSSQNLLMDAAAALDAAWVLEEVLESLLALLLE